MHEVFKYSWRIYGGKKPNHSEVLLNEIMMHSLQNMDARSLVIASMVNNWAHNPSFSLLDHQFGMVRGLACLNDPYKLQLLLSWNTFQELSM